MNKKGDEKLLSVWMFIIWILVALGVVLGVMIFYSAEADVRYLQAGILSLRVSDCIFSDGYVDEKFLKEDFDIFSYCNIDKKLFDENKLFLRVEVIDSVSSDSLLKKEIVYGNKDFEIQCKIREGAEAKNFARCVKKRFVLLYEDDEVKQAVIDVFAGSNIFGGKA
jgi:hypothetical protein